MTAPSDAALLEAVKTAINTLLADPRSTVTFQGRSYTYQRITDLQTMEIHYQGRVNNAAIAAGTVRPLKLFGLRMREPS